MQTAAFVCNATALSAKVLSNEHSSFSKDENLSLHGQVAMAWTRDLGIQGIMVADDEAASNEMQKMTLKMAVPDGIKCIIKTVPEIIALLNNPRSEGMRILVLVKTVKNALEVYKAVPGIEYVNIGNAGRFTSGDGTERTIISRYAIMLDSSGILIK